MKRLFLLTILMMAQFALAKTKINPDILVYTRTETQWNVFLLKEFRTFMNNLSMNIDPYSYKHPANLVYSEENISKYISDDALDLLDTVSTASGINILDVKPQLTVTGFGYSISSIAPIIKPIEKADGNVLLKSKISITGIEAYADDIKLSFIINQDIHGQKIPALEVSIVNPKIILNEGKVIKFALDLLLKENKKDIEMEFQRGDFSRLSQAMKDDPEMIDLLYDDISIPDVSINFMGRNLTINEANIKEIIEERKPSLKIILLDQVRILFEKDGALAILKYFNGTRFDRDYWITTESEYLFPLLLGINDFSVPMEGVLRTELKADACTTIGFERFGENCINNRITQISKSTVSKADNAYSEAKIESELNEDKNLKFLASISEDYINKIIATTIDFGIWKPIVEELGIELGDKGVVVKLDKSGENATVILDVIYDVGKLPGIVLSQRKLRFPVVLETNIRAQYYDVEVQDKNGSVTIKSEPHIVFNIQDVYLDDNILLYGYQKYGFSSTVQNVRKFLGLRKIVIKKIKKELFDMDAPSEPEKFAKWKGVDIPPLLLPEIKDMYLEKMKLESDAHGRLNLTLRGSDMLYRLDTK